MSTTYLSYYLILALVVVVLIYFLYSIFKIIFNFPCQKSIDGILFYDYSFNNIKMDAFTKYAYQIAVKIVKYLPPINDYKRGKMLRALSLSKSGFTPEEFSAINICKSAIIMIVGVFISLLVFPFASIIFLYLGVKLYFDEENKLLYIITKNIQIIDRQLPTFISSIAEEFTFNQNVYDILKKYLDVAGPHLRHELEITIAQISAGNGELAIINLGERVGSEKLSNVCFYLLSALRGSNIVYDFKRLADEYTHMSRLLMKDDIKKLDKKILGLNKYILLTFFIMLIYAFISILKVQFAGIFL